MQKSRNVEIEVKFYLKDPRNFSRRLGDAGAVVIKPRIHERNIRFDDSQGNLQATDQVLRLRKDDHFSLTYKKSGPLKSGAAFRHEYEVTVSDFGTATKILIALGYHAYLSYEKFRTSYAFMQCEVVLDEMPYGWFCEIEGKTSKRIQQAATKLGLNWDFRIVDSYLRLFERWKSNTGLHFKDLSFANFKGLKPTARDLGVDPADC